MKILFYVILLILPVWNISSYVCFKLTNKDTIKKLEEIHNQKVENINLAIENTGKNISGGEVGPFGQRSKQQQNYLDNLELKNQLAMEEESFLIKKVKAKAYLNRGETLSLVGIYIAYYALVITIYPSFYEKIRRILESSS